MKYTVASVLYAAIAGTIWSDGRILFGKKDFTTTTTTTNVKQQYHYHQRSKELPDDEDVNFLIDQPEDSTSFSACLLIKDDNDLLDEWIAYHYLTLPLRHLVIAVDPDSVTTPTSIINKWKDLVGLDVEIWHDKDYRTSDDFVTSVIDKVDAMKTNDDEMMIELHRRRQRAFYGTCLQHHKNFGRSWVALVDDDEYIAFNSIYKDAEDDDHDNENVRRILLPKAHQKKISEFISENPDTFQDKSCFPMTRTLFGPKLLMPTSTTREDKGDDDDDVNDDDYNILELFQEQQKVEEEDTSSFTKDLKTLKYFYHDVYGEQSMNGHLKVMINVRQFTEEELLPENIWSVHRPSKVHCPPIDYYHTPEMDETSIFRVHHYLGSWEDFSGRVDARRNKDVFDTKAEASSRFGPNTEINLSWLNQFIQEVGLHTATKLLSRPPSSTTTTTTTTDVTHQPEEEDKDTMATSSSSCALLFFGLPRQFTDLVYTSLKEYVLDANPNCKVFVHSYDVSVSMEQTDAIPIDTIADLEPMLQHTTDITVDTDEEFQRMYNLEYYRQLFPDAFGWTYPTSMDNMIRQWHSIESSWNLMTNYELSHSMKFDRVGLFRLDVQYQHPISILSTDNSGELAVVPSLMHNTKLWSTQYNDRMFYGVREFAEIWATDRFSSVNEYMTWQQQEENQRNERVFGLHSESYVNYLLREKWLIPVEEKDMCFSRVRATGEIKTSDCDFIDQPTSSGVVVLGMHRSGTSMLSGMLARGAYFVSPGQQLKANEQNPLGFFENYDVVRQNDIWLQEQGYLWDKPFDMKFPAGTNKQGNAVLEVYNPEGRCLPTSPCAKNYTMEYSRHFQNAMFAYTRGYQPWVMKDPRLCITLPSWIESLQSKTEGLPAVIFTYRNPLEVATSLKRRNRNSVRNLFDGLLLWIWYNQMAIWNSQNLCRVVTSNEAILSNPLRELRSIKKDLEESCGIVIDHLDVPAIEKFVDEDLNNSDKISPSFLRQQCIIPHFRSDAATPEERDLDERLYQVSMEVYCDLKNGKAFHDNYVWPDLPAIIGRKASEYLMINDPSKLSGFTNKSKKNAGKSSNDVVTTQRGRRLESSAQEDEVVEQAKITTSEMKIKKKKGMDKGNGRGRKVTKAPKQRGTKAPKQRGTKAPKQRKGVKKTIIYEED